MQRTITLVILVTVFAGMLVVCNGQAGEKCTEATIEGTYGQMLNGTILEVGLTAQVGTITFDGEENCSTAFTRSRMGEITRGGGPCLYTVNSDCTGSITSKDGSPLGDFSIVDGGKEIFYISTNEDPPRVVTGVLKKQ